MWVLHNGKWTSGKATSKRCGHVSSSALGSSLSQTRTLRCSKKLSLSPKNLTKLSYSSFSSDIARIFGTRIFRRISSLYSQLLKSPVSFLLWQVNSRVSIYPPFIIVFDFAPFPLIDFYMKVVSVLVLRKLITLQLGGGFELVKVLSLMGMFQI